MAKRGVLIIIGIGLLLVMFSPMVPGGFYPVCLSFGLALIVYGGFKLLAHKRS